MHVTVYYEAVSQSTGSVEKNCKKASLRNNIWNLQGVNEAMRGKEDLSR